MSSTSIITSNRSFANKIHTIGATEGVMIAYVTKPTNNYEQAYLYPIEYHLHQNELVMQDLQIGTISRRRSEDGKNIQMPSSPGSKYPFHCFVRVVDEIRNNTFQARNSWAHNLCDKFNSLGSDETIFNYPSRFIVYRENSDIDNHDLLPVAKYLLNNNVISLIYHIYSGINMDELAQEDSIVRSF